MIDVDVKTLKYIDRLRGWCLPFDPIDRYLFPDGRKITFLVDSGLEYPPYEFPYPSQEEINKFVNSDNRMRLIKV